MDVRRVTADDAAAVSFLNREVQSRHADALPELFKPPSGGVFSPAQVRELLADPATFMFIAHCGSTPAGYIYAQITRRAESPIRHAWDRLHVHHISVDQAFQRHGVGQALLQAVVEVAKVKGLSTITADFWSINVKARGFFAAQGFTAFSENVWLHVDQDHR